MTYMGMRGTSALHHIIIGIFRKLDKGGYRCLQEKLKP